MGSDEEAERLLLFLAVIEEFLRALQKFWIGIDCLADIPQHLEGIAFFGANM